MQIETLLAALAKAAAAVAGAKSAFEEIRALAESVRSALGEDDRARLEQALAALQAQNESDFSRIDAKLQTAAR